ncbi:YihY/virulence factor BrkB family protein [Demequina sp. SO4-18]|uniref:YihY/virulence factor BrkB family protein n=1 Tax=Demequina sp. SO4-18 TaxID=3401026 RepID=UPI003B592B90
MAEREDPDKPASKDPHRHAADSAFQHTTVYRREQQRLEAKDASLMVKSKVAVKRGKSLKERFDRSHAGRMLERVNDGNGMILAGGIAYFSLTSIAAALVIGVTLASYFVSRNSEWNERFYSFLDESIPGIVGDGENDLVDPSSLEPQTVSGVVGVVSFLILFNTATRYLRGMRVGVRTMLGKEAAPPAQGKLRDFIALFSLVLVVVLGLVLQVVASQFAEVMASWFTVEWVSEGIIRGPAIAVGVLLDMAFAALAIVVLGRYKGPRRPLLWALFAAAIAIGILRQAFSLVVGSLSENAVLGSAVAIVSLLIFVDFIARILLLSSAWLGTNRDVQRVDPEIESDAPESQPRQTNGVTTRKSTVRPGQQMR